MKKQSNNIKKNQKLYEINVLQFHSTFIALLQIKNNLKIIITGGSGFIGSHIATQLKKEHNVTIFDVKKNVADIDFIKGDVTNLESVKS